MKNLVLAASIATITSSAFAVELPSYLDPTSSSSSQDLITFKGVSGYGTIVTNREVCRTNLSHPIRGEANPTYINADGSFTDEALMTLGMMGNSEDTIDLFYTTEYAEECVRGGQDDKTGGFVLSNEDHIVVKCDATTLNNPATGFVDIELHKNFHDSVSMECTMTDMTSMASAQTPLETATGLFMDLNIEAGTADMSVEFGGKTYNGHFEMIKFDPSVGREFRTHKAKMESLGTYTKITEQLKPYYENGFYSYNTDAIMSNVHQVVAMDIGIEEYFSVEGHSECIDAVETDNSVSSLCASVIKAYNKDKELLTEWDTFIAAQAKAMSVEVGRKMIAPSTPVPSDILDTVIVMAKDLGINLDTETRAAVVNTEEPILANTLIEAMTEVLKTAKVESTKNAEEVTQTPAVSAPAATLAPKGGSGSMGLGLALLGLFGAARRFKK